MSAEAQRDGGMEFHGGAPVRNPECDGGACGTCVHRDGGRDFDWGAAGDADCAAGGTLSVCAWDCRDFLDHTRFGAGWFFNFSSVFWRNFVGGWVCWALRFLC